MENQKIDSIIRKIQMLYYHKCMHPKQQSARKYTFYLLISQHMWYPKNHATIITILDSNLTYYVAKYHHIKVNHLQMCIKISPSNSMNLHNIATNSYKKKLLNQKSKDTYGSLKALPLNVEIQTSSFSLKLVLKPRHTSHQ